MMDEKAPVPEGIPGTPGGEKNEEELLPEEIQAQVRPDVTSELTVLSEGEEEIIEILPDETIVDEEIIESAQIHPEEEKESQAIKYFRQGLEFFGQQQYAESAQAFDRATNLEPKNAQAWYNKALVLSRLGARLPVGQGTQNIIDAIQAYDKTLKLDAKNIKVWVNRGIILDSLGRYEEAIKSFDRVNELDTKNANAWVSKGILYGKLGKLEEKIKAYAKATEINPNIKF